VPHRPLHSFPTRRSSDLPEPPAEFQPVFSAFRRMASDLSASQMALEEAERRTAAVLRQVASAVVAVDARGVVTLFNPAAALLLRSEEHTSELQSRENLVC